MKKIIVILLVATVGLVAQCQAGFIIKKSATTVLQTEQLATDERTVIESDGYAPAALEAPPVAHENVAKKHSFLSRLIHKVAAAKAEISKGLYVVLAIIALGWLAMGINDNFSGYEWLLSLLLYILGWLPGVIYTLIMMKKYYK